ncbi:MAG: carboxymuconolactone decarboxylase family protein [bacterium]|nr:carboxymuconolactone decarboxylase family protein [bacterium]
MSSERFEAGLEIRREVVGAEYVDAAIENAGEFGRPFQEWVTEACWGSSWTRDALSRRDRSLLVLAITGALGREAEFRLHVRGAVRNGCTAEEISDTILHTAVYAGAPAGVTGFKIAQEVLREEGVIA